MKACEYLRVHEGIKGENPRGITNVWKQNLSQYTHQTTNLGKRYIIKVLHSIKGSQHLTTSWELDTFISL